MIAVNYEARQFGVKRNMRGEQAKTVCPEIHIFSVTESRGKADLNKYRDASAEVFDVISEFAKEYTFKLEKASIDEAYLDLTDELDKQQSIIPSFDELGENSHLQLEEAQLENWLEFLKENSEFYQDEIKLLMGAAIVKKIRDKIYEKTQFKCSAGISHNKMLAKLACGINKPNAQTILPFAGVRKLFDGISIDKVRNLGGKLGEDIKQTYGIKTMGELREICPAELRKTFGIETGDWINGLANGIDMEKVSDRILARTIGCGKNFPGKNALLTVNEVAKWLNALCDELMERLNRDKELNKRSAKNVSVTFRMGESDKITSRTVHIDSYPHSRKLCQDIVNKVFNKIKFESITTLSLSASKFQDDLLTSSKINKLDKYFTKENCTKQTESSPNETKSRLNETKPRLNETKSSLSETKSSLSETKSSETKSNESDSSSETSKATDNYSVGETSKTLSVNNMDKQTKSYKLDSYFTKIIQKRELKCDNELDLTKKLKSDSNLMKSSITIPDPTFLTFNQVDKDVIELPELEVKRGFFYNYFLERNNKKPK